MQVLGDVRAAFDVTKTDNLIIGKDGLLVRIPHPSLDPHPHIRSVCGPGPMDQPHLVTSAVVLSNPKPTSQPLTQPQPQVCGKNLMRYEKMLIAYLAMLCREIFIRNFFVRLFVLDDLLVRIRALIVTYFEDPNYVARIRELLNKGEGVGDVVLSGRASVGAGDGGVEKRY